MNRLLRIAIAAAVCAVCMATAVGCLKGYDGNVVYVLKPLVSNGSENEDVDHYITAYAYYADTTHWTVASYDDAVAGRIVRKEGAEELTTPNFTAYYESDSGLYGMEVTAVPLMAVVVDRVNRIYAYTKFEPDLEGESPTWPVVFRPWRSEPKYKEGDWQMVNDRAAPES